MNHNCKFCNLNFKSEYLFNKHKTRKIPCTYDLQCKKCKKMFKRKVDLDNHYKRKTPCVKEEGVVKMDVISIVEKEKLVCMKEKQEFELKKMELEIKKMELEYTLKNDNIKIKTEGLKEIERLKTERKEKTNTVINNINILTVDKMIIQEISNNNLPFVTPMTIPAIRERFQDEYGDKFGKKEILEILNKCNKTKCLSFFNVNKVLLKPIINHDKYPAIFYKEQTDQLYKADDINTISHAEFEHDIYSIIKDIIIPFWVKSQRYIYEVDDDSLEYVKSNKSSIPIDLSIDVTTPNQGDDDDFSYEPDENIMKQYRYEMGVLNALDVNCDLMYMKGFLQKNNMSEYIHTHIDDIKICVQQCCRI
jgi:hypothetical protein